MTTDSIASLCRAARLLALPALAASMPACMHLNDPVAGMRGGGQGECPFSAGRTVDAVVAKA